jgi:hypothetical protein
MREITDEMRQAAYEAFDKSLSNARYPYPKKALDAALDAAIAASGSPVTTDTAEQVAAALVWRHEQSLAARGP